MSCPLFCTIYSRFDPSPLHLFGILTFVSYTCTRLTNACMQKVIAQYNKIRSQFCCNVRYIMDARDISMAKLVCILRLNGIPVDKMILARIYHNKAKRLSMLTAIRLSTYFNIPLEIMLFTDIQLHNTTIQRIALERAKKSAENQQLIY